MVLFDLLQLAGVFLYYLRIEYLWHALIMPLTNRNGIIVLTSTPSEVTNLHRGAPQPSRSVLLSCSSSMLSSARSPRSSAHWLARGASVDASSFESRWSVGRFCPGCTSSSCARGT